jgi:hypothetical protein
MPLLAAAVFVRENSGKQRKTASRFAVIWVAEAVAAQDFRHESEIGRCKFPGKTAKNSESARSGPSVGATKKPGGFASPAF